MTDKLARRLSTLFSREGFTSIDPPILQAVGPFMDLSGENVRRRMYLTRDPEGREFCLRPDFTIPTALQHVLEPASGRYAYLGPVFRHRPGQDGPGEFIQAGVEWFGETDEAAADADILRLALETTKTGGVPDPITRVGDIGLQSSFLNSLDLPEVWRRRLWRQQGRKETLSAVLDTKSDPSAGYPALAQLMKTSDIDTAASVIEDVLRLGGTESVGGRTPNDIAQRFVEKTLAGPGLSDEQRRALIAFDEIEGPYESALERIGRSFPQVALDAVELRGNAMQKAGIDLSKVRFDAGFARPLDYHNGFVFDLSAPKTGEKLIGGGRYDALTEILGAKTEPAVGFSLWLERLAKVGRIA